MKKTISLLFVFIFWGATILSAQAGNEPNETTNLDSNAKCNGSFSTDFDFGTIFGSVDKQDYMDYKSPTIEFLYGTTESGFDNFQPFKKNFNVEGRLGITNSSLLDNSNYVIRYNFNYISLNHVNSSLGNPDNTLNAIENSTWRVTLSDNSGYGWKLAPNTAIVLYAGDGLAWSKTKFEDSILTISEKPTTSRLSDGIRFGQQYEAGVKIKLFKYVTIGAAYECNQIYERFLFWKWAGSGVIEGAGHGLVGLFINKIQKRAPAVVPIVNFVLQNAVSYGMYELRKTDMNWPFETAPPYVQNNFKLSLGFNF